MNNSIIKMKRPLAAGAAFVVLGLASTADAALFSRLGGQAVYDEDLDVTWIADADLSVSNSFGVYLETDPVGGNPGTTWQSSQDWIAAMNTSGGAGYLGMSNWRLPICDGADCANGEMEHLFKTEGISNNSPGFFSNVTRNYYWTGTDVASDSNYAWGQDISGSSTDVFKTNTGWSPWAVRWGDVPSEACSVSFDLPTNQWHQISLPCDPGPLNKASDIFPNMPGNYGTDWVVYRYDESSSDYQDVGETGTLEQSKGYWIIQKGHGVVTLSMPQGSTPAATLDCVSSPRGCVEMPLSINASWTMIGYPHYTKGTFGELFLATNDEYYPGYGTLYRTGVCARDLSYRDGCSLREASGYEISSGQLWSYDGTQYVQIKNDNDALSPWVGYWLGILPRAGEFEARGIVTVRTKAGAP